MTARVGTGSGLPDPFPPGGGANLADLAVAILGSQFAIIVLGTALVSWATFGLTE